jgi:hypothetical protein
MDIQKNTNETPNPEKRLSMSFGSDFFLIIRIVKAVIEALLELASEGKIEK